MPYRNRETGQEITRQDILKAAKAEGISVRAIYYRLAKAARLPEDKWGALEAPARKTRKRATRKPSEQRPERRCPYCQAPTGWRRAVGLANKWLELQRKTGIEVDFGKAARASKARPEVGTS